MSNILAIISIFDVYILNFQDIKLNFQGTSTMSNFQVIIMNFQIIILKFQDIKLNILVGHIEFSKTVITNFQDSLLNFQVNMLNFQDNISEIQDKTK